MTLYIDTKPELDWKEVNDFMSGRYWVAHSTFGMYHVVMEISGGEHFQLTHTYNSTTTFFHDRPTLSEAKAAAQADYERRTAERFIPIGDLLERAAQLVGNPATNISGSTDLACAKWKEDYANIKTALDRAKGREYP